MSDLAERTMLTLAEPTRLRIVELLAEEPRRVGEIARALDMSGPATSRHLRVLRLGGVIEEVTGSDSDDARVRVYRLRPEPFAALRDWVGSIERFWTTQLDAFRAYTEETKNTSD